MAIKVAINGFGRIGRIVARAIINRPDCGLELVSINDLASAAANAMLFKRDSVHGTFEGSVETDGNDLVINGKRIHVTLSTADGVKPAMAGEIDEGKIVPLEHPLRLRIALVRQTARQMKPDRR